MPHWDGWVDDVELDRNGLEVLDRSTCLLLLTRMSVGRIGITSGALPAVLPVNYLLDGERILIRTRGGSKLDAALRGAVVAFEIDDVDPVSHTGWSVVVTGVTHEITDAEEVARLQRLPLARWAPHGADHIMAISTDMVSGRRIVPHAAAPSAAASPADEGVG